MYTNEVGARPLALGFSEMRAARPGLLHGLHGSNRQQQTAAAWHARRLWGAFSMPASATQQKSSFQVKLVLLGLLPCRACELSGRGTVHAGFALQKGYVRIVQLSLLGSVVSNLLLVSAAPDTKTCAACSPPCCTHAQVMGSAFIAGGIKYPTQRFNQTVRLISVALQMYGRACPTAAGLQGINVNCSLLLLATLAVMLPSLLSETQTAVHE